MKWTANIPVSPVTPTTAAIASCVPPQVWDETCARQGSWYRASRKKGLYLVISSFELEGYGEKKEAIITLSDFDPPRIASLEEKHQMISESEFINQIPPGWEMVKEIEKKMWIFLK